MSLAAVKAAAWPHASGLSGGEAVLAPNVAFHGPAPIGALNGPDEVSRFWLQPLSAAFPTGQKKPFLYFADHYHEADWIGATGWIRGPMVEGYLGVPASAGETRHLRYGEFLKVQNGLITEIRTLFDLPGLASQAGIELLPAFAGRNLRATGPETRLGLPENAPEAETLKTRRLVADMIGGLNRLKGSNTASQGIEAFWHSDMKWHGPHGVGSTFGMEEFYAHAQGPSVRSFPGRRGTWPKTAFVVEGHVAGFTGWPSLVGEFTGEAFRGIPATCGPISQTIMDFYVRRDEKLAENWVLIDLIDFADQCGIDLLEPLKDSD